MRDSAVLFVEISCRFTDRYYTLECSYRFEFVLQLRSLTTAIIYILMHTKYRNTKPMNVIDVFFVDNTIDQVIKSDLLTSS